MDAQLQAHDLEPGVAMRRVDLDLDLDAHRSRSRLLHRLRFLEIPGFHRTQGFGLSSEPDLKETWSIHRSFDADSALIEAAAWGATLEEAATARLLSAVGQATDLAALARVLVDAVFLGLDVLSHTLLGRVREAAGTEPDLAVLGKALSLLLLTWRTGRLLSPGSQGLLTGAMEAAWERGLWLVEGTRAEGAPADDGRIRAVHALRDTLLYGSLRATGQARLDLDPVAADGVMTRASRDPEAPPDLKGAALGFRWSIGAFESVEEAEAEALAATGAVARPQTLGDFLAGLFALAREEVRTSDRLVGAMDEALQALEASDFLVALPSLRMAFSWFPPREREDIARLVLPRHGGGALGARDLVRTPVDPMEVAEAVALERTLLGRLRAWGLLEGGA